MQKLFLKSRTEWFLAPFALVLKRPERLQVRVMARRIRLHVVSQIKQRKWATMIEVPTAVVRPRHAGLEQRFDVVPEGGYRNSQSLHRRDAARFTKHCFAQAMSKILRDSALKVLRALLGLIYTRHSQMPRSVLSAPLPPSLSLRLLVRSVFAPLSVSFHVSATNPLCGLFRRIQNSSRDTQRRSLCIRSRSAFFSVASDAGIVHPTQPAQLWMLGARSACAGLRKWWRHVSILTLSSGKPHRETWDDFHAQARGQVVA